MSTVIRGTEWAFGLPSKGAGGGGANTRTPSQMPSPGEGGSEQEQDDVTGVNPSQVLVVEPLQGHRARGKRCAISN